MHKIGEKITELRNNNNLSQTALAKALTLKGITVSNKTISKWEKDDVIPNAYQFLALCSILKVHNILEVFGFNATASPLNSLNAEGKQKVHEYINLLNASNLYSKKNYSLLKRELKLFDLPVSAGYGEFIDSEHYELIEVGSEVAENADFGVRISGDSMEPLFINNQIVWIHKQDTLEDNEIGIFVYNDNAYCKKLSLNEGNLKLISLNKKYPDIIIKNSSSLYVIGKVIS